MLDLRKAAQELIAIGNYNLDASVASGGFGTVVRGHHIVSKTQTAIKFIDRKNGESDMSIQREVHILHRLKHPNIVRFYEFCSFDWFVCISMEYINGLTIQDCLAKFGVFSELAAKDVAGQMASGLSYLHGNSLMHLDLKIDNVIIRSDGTIKIIDFGYSRSWELAQEMTSFPGHPLFSAPEMFRRDIFYGPSVDIWSFGVILYTMLFEVYPFPGDGPSNVEKGKDKALIKQILRGFGSLPQHHEYLANISEPGQQVLIQCLAGNHETRLTAQGILESQWILKDNPFFGRIHQSGWSLSREQFSQVINYMKKFTKTPRASSREIVNHLNQRPYGATSALYRIIEHSFIDGSLPCQSPTTPKLDMSLQGFVSPPKGLGDVFDLGIESQEDTKQSEALRGILRPSGIKKQVNRNVRFAIAKTHESKKIGDEHLVINPIRRRQPLMNATPMKITSKDFKMNSNLMKIPGTPMRANKANSKFQMPNTLLYYLNK